MQLYLNVGNDGRILIPKIMREALEIKNNSKVIAHIEDNTLHISSVSSSLENARALVRKYCKNKTSVVDDFLKERRLEAKLEEQKFSKFSKDKQQSE